MGINSYSTRNFNPRGPFVLPDDAFAPTADAVYLLLALFNRTGGSAGGAVVKVGIVAAGNSQASAFGLQGDWNYVETVDAGTGVSIPAINVGSDCIVFNAGANTLSIYPAIVTAPALPIQIDALGVNAPYPLAAGKMQWFRMVKPALLTSMQLG